MNALFPLADEVKASDVGAYFDLICGFGDAAEIERGKVSDHEALHHFVADHEGMASFIIFSVEDAAGFFDVVDAVVEDENGAGPADGQDVLKDALDVKAVLDDI